MTAEIWIQWVCMGPWFLYLLQVMLILLILGPHCEEQKRKTNFIYSFFSEYRSNQGRMWQLLWVDSRRFSRSQELEIIDSGA